MLHDPAVRSALEARLAAIRPDSPRQWGSMTVDQMLHHVNIVLMESLGEHTAKPNIRGLPESLVRWAILNMPWGKGAPTRPDMIIPAGERFDFESEKAQCLAMIRRFLAQPLESAWPRAANFAMTGKHWSQLQYKHLDHHLTQFGV